MSLTNPNKPVTEARLQEFYHRIKNFLGFTEMPSEDMSEVASPIPSVMNRLPVLFDETEAEYVVGWYKLANGTKKPVYQKSYTHTFGSDSTMTLSQLVATNVDEVVDYHSIVKYSGQIEKDLWQSIQFVNNAVENVTKIWPWTNTNNELYFYELTGNPLIYNQTYHCTCFYTKTTDTPQ